jgi:hypothetical protein
MTTITQFKAPHETPTTLILAARDLQVETLEDLRVLVLAIHNREAVAFEHEIDGALERVTRRMRQVITLLDEAAR